MSRGSVGRIAARLEPERGERGREVLRERQRGLVPDVERAADDRAVVGVLDDVHDGAREVVEVARGARPDRAG